MADISTNCECVNVPDILLMMHELEKLGRLHYFLLNNKLTIPNPISLLHFDSAVGHMWHNVSHLSGIGLEDGTDEIWTLRYEWLCSNTIENTTIGDYTWHYGLMITRQQRWRGNGQVVRNVAKYKVIFAPRLNTMANLNLIFVYDGRTGITTESLSDIPVIDTKITDDIGIFDGTAWQSDPTLSIRIAEQEPTSTVPKYDMTNLDGIGSQSS